MEKLFKAIWWDYSDKRSNINGRICLETLIGFGALSLVLVYAVNPFFVSIIDKFSSTLLITISMILLVIFIVDMCISLKVISGFKNVANSIHKDNTEEITKKIKELLLKKSWLYKRLVGAFDFKASERLLKNLHRIAMDTIEKGTTGAKKIINNGVEVTKNTIEKSSTEAIKVIKGGVNVAKKTIKETKEKVRRKSK
jgi:uncharacterized membrane protein